MNWKSEFKKYGKALMKNIFKKVVLVAVTKFIENVILVPAIKKVNEICERNGWQHNSDYSDEYSMAF